MHLFSNITRKEGAKKKILKSEITLQRKVKQGEENRIIERQAVIVAVALEVPRSSLM